MYDDGRIERWSIKKVKEDFEYFITRSYNDNEAKILVEEFLKSKVKAEAELKKAKAEALKILVEAEKKSEERKDAILKDAHAQREKMIKSGEAEVEKQKEIAMKDLQVYARNLISDFTEKLVSNKTASTLIDEAIDKVGEE
jgi:F-type H+-transporting ATPase subunit b